MIYRNNGPRATMRDIARKSGFSISAVSLVLNDAPLAKYIPDIRAKLDHAEASTPVTFQHYTKHVQGASFGTKFEGLAVSRGIPQQIAGLYHAGSVGIIMSGWLGAMNYGVIVANDVDLLLMKGAMAHVPR